VKSLYREGGTKGRKEDVTPVLSEKDFLGRRKKKS